MPLTGFHSFALSSISSFSVFFSLYVLFPHLKIPLWAISLLSGLTFTLVFGVTSPSSSSSSSSDSDDKSKSKKSKDKEKEKDKKKKKEKEKEKAKEFKSEKGNEKQNQNSDGNQNPKEEKKEEKKAKVPSEKEKVKENSQNSQKSKVGSPLSVVSSPSPSPSPSTQNSKKDKENHSEKVKEKEKEKEKEKPKEKESEKKKNTNSQQEKPKSSPSPSPSPSPVPTSSSSSPSAPSSSSQSSSHKEEKSKPHPTASASPIIHSSPSPFLVDDDSEGEHDSHHKKANPNSQDAGEWTTASYDSGKSKGGNQVNQKGKNKKSENNPSSSLDSSSPAASASVTPSETKIDFSIPSSSISLIIGSGGKTLQTIQNETNTKVQLPLKGAETSSPNILVTISGLGPDVQRAKGVIDSLVRLGYSSITHPGQIHDDLSVETKQIGLLIGPGGKYLKAIQEKTNTRINFPKKTNNVNDNKSNEREKVVIVGTKENVKLARKAMKDLLVDGFSSYTHEGFVKGEIDFPQDRIALLIGAKGQTIKSIMGNTKTRINTPKDNTSPVTIIGSHEGVEAAKKEIQRLLVDDRIVNSISREEDKDNEESQQFDTEEEYNQKGAWGQQTAPQSEVSLW